MCCRGSGAIRARAEPLSRYSCACAHRPALQHRTRTHAHSHTTQSCALRCAARTPAHAHPKDARTLPPLSHARGVRECPRPFVLRDTDGRVGRSHGVLRRRVLPLSARRRRRMPTRLASLGCQGGLLSCARPQPHVGPRYAMRRARARAHVVCRRAALHVGVDRCYARRCMVFPLRASCAVPGVVDDFDPMEGSCKIRRFRRGMSHICAGTCAGMCARLRCCGAFASV